MRRRHAIARVRRGGRTWEGRCLRVKYLDNETGRARLALGISKKVGGAVIRNQYKRWIREAFRCRQADAAGFDLLATVRFGAVPHAYEDVRRDWDALCRDLRERRFGAATP